MSWAHTAACTLHKLNHSQSIKNSTFFPGQRAQKTKAFYNCHENVIMQIMRSSKRGWKFFYGVDIFWCYRISRLNTASTVKSLIENETIFEHVGTEREIVIFYTEILTGKVVLWCFFLIEISEKIHNSTFKVKISI